MVEKAITYVWLTGHIRNVGDSALRRPYVHSIKSFNDVQVWGGRKPESDGYLSGLQLSENEISPSFFSWYRKLCLDLTKRKVNFAFNAGAFGVTKEYFFGILAILPLLVVLKLRGGKVLWLGSAIATKKKGFTWPFFILAGIADSMRWRDTESSSVFVKRKSMPDWAFGAKPLVSEEQIDDVSRRRNKLVLSLRGDRTYPSEEWLDLVEDLANRLRLQIVVCVQVKEDQLYAEKMADRFAAELVGWEYETHIDQERLVRSVYKDTQLILSDRLHGLIIAATEGAVPLGWCESSTTKISRHFNQVNAQWVSCDPGSVNSSIRDLTADQVDIWHGEIVEIVGSAAGDIDKVVLEIGEVLESRETLR